VVVTYRRTRRAPAAPTGLTARAGDRSVALAWAPNAESDLAGYRVYRQSPDGGWPAIAATATTRHLDSGLLNGTRYTYRVTAYDRRGNESRPSSEVSAVPTAASTSPGSGTPVSPLSAWRSGFETGDFREWDWWGQTQPEQYPSTMGVVDPTTRGVPYKAGTKVGWFQTTPQDIAVGRYHAKLYKYFHSGAGDRPNWSCPNVSGTYRAWFYLPSNYAVLNSNAVVLFQFKDQYWINRATGEETSSPTWWLALKSPADAGVAAPRADYPVAVVEHWDYWNLDPGYAHPGLRVLAPLGRWFEVRAEVYDKDHIEFYLDGQQLATGSNSHYPVGCSHPDSFNWIFGIGQYSSSPGVLYADEASYTPR
jgi:chitodextrinase